MLKNRVSKLMAYILTGVMTFSALGTSAYAAEDITPVEDTCLDEGVKEESEIKTEDDLEVSENNAEESVSIEESDTPIKDTEAEELKEQGEEPGDVSVTTSEDSKSVEDTNTDEMAQNKEITTETENGDKEAGEKPEENEEPKTEEKDNTEDVLTEKELVKEAGSAKVEAIGILPEDAELSVKDVTYIEAVEQSVNDETDEGSFKVFEAYDIEIISGGETWQPVEHDSIVTIKIIGADIPKEEEIEVYRIEDDDAGVTLLSSEATEDGVSFETEHFTVFTIGSTTYETDDATTKWDVSEAQDESIMAYWYEDEGKLVITGSGRIKDYDWYGNKTSPISDMGDKEFEVIFSDDIERIGNYFMQNCKKAKIDNLPSGLKEIGDSALSGCKGAAFSELPEGLLRIEKYGIAYCSNITVSRLPSTLIEIGNAAFYGCDNMTVNTLPEGITTVPKEAFCDCDGITEMTLHTGVTTIGESAFRSCSKLVAVYLSDSVTTISKNAFYYSDNLKDITGGNGLTSIGEKAFYAYLSGSSKRPIATMLHTESDLLLNYDWASDNRRVVTGIAENDSGYNVDGIEPWDISEDGDMSVLAYYIEDQESGDKLVIVGSGNTKSYGYGKKSIIAENCKDKTFELIIGNKITSIGDSLFSGCANMTCKEIPGSVQSVGQYGFNGCKSIDPVFNEGLTSVGYWGFFGCIAMSTDKLPDSLTTLGTQCFAGCEKLSITELPAGLTVIPGGAFSNCENLMVSRIEDSVTSIGDAAFKNCAKMPLTYLSDNVTKIGMNTFYCCEECTIDKLPSALTKIEWQAFTQCEKITISEIPEGVTEIDGSAFANCLGITSLKLPDSLTTIGHWAFMGCYNMTEITGGDNVTELSTQVFLPNGVYIRPDRKLKTKLITNSQALLDYDWEEDYRTLAIGGSFTVVLPASITLEDDGNGFTGSAEIIVDTTGLEDKDAVFVEAEESSYLEGYTTNIWYTTTMTKNQWVSGDSESGTLTLKTEYVSNKFDNYRGNVAIKIYSKKVK